MVQIVPVNETHGALEFRCREPALTSFLRDDAWKSERLGLARTFVAELSGPIRVAGYYSLMMGRLTATDLPAERRVSASLSQLPVVVLGKLARDDRMGPATAVAPILMRDLFERSLRAALDVGAVGITLDAKNAGLVSYYEKWDFEPVGKGRFPRKMFVALADVRATLSGT